MVQSTTSRTTSSDGRARLGRVSVYPHHGAWWIYCRVRGRAVRRRVGERPAAECAASLLNAQLVADEAGVTLERVAEALADLLGQWTSTGAAPAPAASATVAPAELRRRFLEHHEQVLGSALGTISRYATATQHLVNFADARGIEDAMAVDVGTFVTYLRTVNAAPNGHRNTHKRPLRDKGIKYILETCRSLYRFGQRQGLLPDDRPSPFSAFGIGRLQVRDRKPIFVFSPEQELAFFRAADTWAFSIHLTLARTGLRPGELVHLLIEDIDLDEGWLHMVQKPELGWSIKTGRERRVPLVPELVELLRKVIGTRTSGPVFVRQRFTPDAAHAIGGDRAQLANLARGRIDSAEHEAGRPLTRQEQARVDVLVRQETLGHKPTDPDRGALGMTGVYTHTSPEFQRQEIERALRLRPRSLALVKRFTDDA